MAQKNFGYIQITRKCNRKCAFCSNPPVEDELTFSEAKKQIDNYAKKGVNEIIFTGGEPTINDCLPELIKYCQSIGMACRIITNAQKLARLGYAEQLADAGLEHAMISIYSHKKEIEEKLTKTKGSYEKTLHGIKNALECINCVNLNITINSLNCRELHETIRFLAEKFPKIQHYVFNNLDPTGRALKNKWAVPKLVDLELSLQKTLEYLDEQGKTFRVERVPLCYMQGFEQYSTETRQIVKDQAYRCLFLDKKGRELREIKIFYYLKDECCKLCRLNEICAGLNPRYTQIYGFAELFPVFLDKERIISRINN